MGLYDTTALIGIISSLRVPGNFLRTLFFGAAPLEFDTPDVKFDRVFDDLRIAPFVSPYAPGKPDQDRGFQTDTFAPAYVKPIDRVDPHKISRRRPGEPIGGAFTLAQRRDLAFVDYLQGQKNKIERREEVMASEILRTGGVTIVGEDYPLATVSFTRQGSLTKTLTGAGAWGQAGVSPVAMVSGWIDEVAEASGAAPSHVIFDKLAWADFAADPALKTVVDLTLGQGHSSVELGFAPGAPGSPVFKGRIGTVELYVYNDTYEDRDGTIKKLIPSNTVIVGAPAAHEGTPCYGAILDPRNNYGAAKIFSKNWIDENPGAEWVMSQSAPILVPKRPNATLCATTK